MQQLTVIGIEDDVLVVESASGERFQIDASTLPTPRRKPQVVHERKASPREIQALMRGGMTANEVAQHTGEQLEYVERFEGPVLAERNHILDEALSISVASGDIDPLAGETTFGAAVGERLADIRATDQSWSSWKDESGAWIVRLRFVNDEVERDAQWTFEPKKGALTPRNKEATALSQQGDATSVLVPRLRAVSQETNDDAPAQTHFDSGAFRVDRPAAADRHEHAPDERQDAGPDSSASQPSDVQNAAIARAPRAATEANHTADLLEALRRRRGEREAALAEAEREPAPEALFDVEHGESGEREERSGVHHTSPLGTVRPKRGSRASMPSWDEIVFGSKNDDD